jgi:hypothetical protein
MEKFLERICCPAADFRMPRFLIVPEFPLCLVVERGKQIESNVGRLKMSRIGVCNVVTQAAHGRFARECARLAAHDQSCGVTAGDQAGCDRFGVTFHT